MIEQVRHFIHHLLIDHFPSIALKRDWYLTYGTPLNLESPTTLNEKIQWLMLNSDISKWTQCADKYLVRDYVKEKGHEDILTQLYGVWEDVESIDYDTLPDKFVIKCNHDCESTHIVDKRKGFDQDALNADLKKHLQTVFGYESCELHYTKIKPLVLAEEYIPLTSNELSSSQIDYKIWCFNGKAHNIWVAFNRTHESVYVNSYDLNWQVHPEHSVFTNHFRDGKGMIPRPLNFDKMIQIAEDLADGFPEVRVDLYNVQGKIYFGEMTFTSGKGKMDYFSDVFQKEMGSLITIKK